VDDENTPESPERTFTERGWAEVAFVLRRLGNQQGTFDADEAALAILNDRRLRGALHGSTANIFAVLRDFEDLQHIERVGRRGDDGPIVWRWIG
jgi:hypothetical protein